MKACRDIDLALPGKDFATNVLRHELRSIADHCGRVDAYPRTIGRAVQVFLSSGSLENLPCTDELLEGLWTAEQGFRDIACNLSSSRAGIEILKMDRLVALRLDRQWERA